MAAMIPQASYRHYTLFLPVSSIEVGLTNTRVYGHDVFLNYTVQRQLCFALGRHYGSFRQKHLDVHKKTFQIIKNYEGSRSPIGSTLCLCLLLSLIIYASTATHFHNATGLIKYFIHSNCRLSCNCFLVQTLDVGVQLEQNQVLY